MKKLTFFLFAIPFFISAQDFNIRRFSMESFSMVESRTLKSNFFTEFYTGGFLDSSLKNSTLSVLKDVNSLGYFTQNSFQYAHIKDQKSVGPFLSASYHNILGMSFSNDFFELAFMGNEGFVGQDADLLPLDMKLFEFAAFKGGVFWKNSGGTAFFAAIGPVLGLNYQEIESKEMQMFTGEMVDSISLDYSINYWRTASAPFVKGYGFALQTGAEGIFAGFHWSIMADNVGLIHFNQKSVVSTKDSLIQFSGFEIDELDNISNSLENELTRLENAFSLSGDTANLNVALPFSAQFSIKKDFKFLNLEFNALHINMQGFFPQLSLIPSKAVGKRFSVLLPLKYGGFGAFNAGLGLNVVFNGNMGAKVFSPALLSLSGLQNPLSYGLFFSVFYKITPNEVSF